MKCIMCGDDGIASDDYAEHVFGCASIQDQFERRIAMEVAEGQMPEDHSQGIELDS